MESRDIRSGQRIGAYEVEEEIGRGGMAIVYKARHVSLGRYVALKILLPHLATDTEIVHRFLQEARAAAALRHPNIVTVYDVGQSDGFYYIAMEYIEGQSLQTLIQRRGRLPPQEVVSILKQVAAALDEAHRQGIVHRDVKPSNVLIEARTGRGVLTDFGVARVMHGGPRLTQTGAFIGTLHYASPEQLQGKEVDHRADLYALGVMTFEMLTGHVPFSGDAGAVVAGHLQRPPPSVRQYVPSLPTSVDEALAPALAKDPARRYRSATALARALEQALAGVASSPPTTEAKPWPRGLVFGGATFLVGLLVVVAFLVVRLARSAPAVPPPPSPTQLKGSGNGDMPGVTVTPLIGLSPFPTLVTPTSRPDTPTVSGGTSSIPTSTPTPTATATPPPTSTPTPTVTPVQPPEGRPTQNLNLRSGPGVSFERLTTLPVGSRVTVLGRNGDGSWLYVRSKDDLEGWVAASYVDLDGAIYADLPTVPTPVAPLCSLRPDGRFTGVYTYLDLGCALGPARIVWTAWEPLERGAMLWRADTNRVTVFYQGDGWEVLLEQWDGRSVPPPRGTPPPGRQAPVRGFGWIWGTRDDIFAALGWATDEEKGFAFTKAEVQYCADAQGNNMYSRANELPPLLVVAVQAGKQWKKK